MEKEIWKWILDGFSNEGIANIALRLGIKIPGFRQLNPKQSKFKIVRPKIIMEALKPKNEQSLVDFFEIVAKKQTEAEAESLREQSIEELLEIVEDGLPPSLILSVLLTGEDEEHRAKAEELYTTLNEQGKLDLLEQQADEMVEDEEIEDEEDNLRVKTLQEELKSAQQQIDKLEKKLKKVEQKSDDLKLKEAKAKTELKNERNRSKEEKNTLLNEINVLKGEVGNLKHQVKSFPSEKENFQKKQNKQSELIKTKDKEISRLNALVLKLTADLEKLPEKLDRTAEKHESMSSANPKVKVALIGDPKNTKILKYVNNLELTILQGIEVEENETYIVLNSSDQVWLLTYKIPRSIQKRVRARTSQEKIKEFATFNELENYMLKGML